MTDSKDNTGNPRMSEEHLERLLKETGKRPEPPAEMAKLVKANVKQAWQEEVQKAAAQRASARRRTQWLGIAASLVVAIAGLFFGLQTTTAPAVAGHLVQVVAVPEYRLANDTWQPLTASVGNLAQGTEIRTSANAYASFRLGNGMHVRLNSNSQLLLRGTDTLELLSGAVYAESPESMPGSVQVITPFGVAEDIGTEFEVMVNPTSWRVQVREGQVSMSSDKHNLTADAGQRITIADNHQVTEERVSAADSSWGWTHQVTEPFQLEGATLASYLAWWSSETGKQPVFATLEDQALAEQLKLHGRLDGLSLADGLTAVLASTGFHVVDSSAEQVIFAR
jgi:ferric-dicitrate binding protein FerR (iron transport regulator)